MAYRFDTTQVTKANIYSWMPKKGRRVYKRFIRTFGDIDDTGTCPFCDGRPRHFQHSYEWSIGVWQHARIKICPICFWFRHHSYFMNRDCDVMIEDHFSTYQKETKPLNELSTNRLAGILARRWKDKNLISPAQAQDLVAQIFAEHMNCKIHYTTNGVYTPDGGIDFALVETDSGLEYAFQVKRRLTENPERVRPVREFLGSLAGTKYERGYFVTFAPRFTSKVVQEVNLGSDHLRRRRLDIQLVDGNRLKQLLSRHRTKSLANHPLSNLKDKSTNNSIHQENWREVPSRIKGHALERLSFGPWLPLSDILKRLEGTK